MIQDSNPNLFKNLARDLTNVRKVIVKQAAQIRKGIFDRTKSGRDENGNSFKPYDPLYRAYREEKGRQGTPNLMFYAHMLNSMDIREIRDGAQIYFSDAAEEDKCRWNEKKRPFFAVDNGQLKTLENAVNISIGK